MNIGPTYVLVYFNYLLFIQECVKQNIGSIQLDRISTGNIIWVHKANNGNAFRCNNLPRMLYN